MFVQTDGTEQSDYIGRQDLQFQFAPLFERLMIV